VRVAGSVLLLAALLGTIAYVAIPRNGREHLADTPLASPSPEVPAAEVLEVPVIETPEEERPDEDVGERVFREGTVLHAKTLEPIAGAIMTILGREALRARAIGDLTERHPRSRNAA